MTFVSDRLFAGRKNSIHRFLDEKGVPWRSKRQDLIGRFGVRKDLAYEWDVIEVNTKLPVVTGMIRPLSAQAFKQFSPLVPVSQFGTHAYFGEDARKNLSNVENEIYRVLGPAENIDTGNAFGRIWKSGTAQIRAYVWPANMQRVAFKIPAHERDPRLRAACAITIETGFRLPLSPSEQGAVKQYVSIGRISGNLLYGRVTPQSIYCTPPHQSELEFIREPTARHLKLYPTVGHSRDLQYLIFCHAQLYVIPLQNVVHIRVRRILPAKGGGGSFLDVECLTGYEEMASKWISVSSGVKADDLNELAEKMSRAIGRPYELLAYEYDT